MKLLIRNSMLRRFVLLVVLVAILFVSGCARYARNADMLYEPATNIRGGTGDVYLVIPENQATRSPDIKWILGTVSDGEKRKIDEIFSSRSDAEIIQAALGLEFKRAGYTVIPAHKRPAAGQNVIDLTKAEIKLNQTSEVATIKADCTILLTVDAYTANQPAKQYRYEASSSKTDIKDRDMLAKSALQDALQAALLRVVPDMHNLFKQ